jgi:PASTA domain
VRLLIVTLAVSGAAASWYLATRGEAERPPEAVSAQFASEGEQPFEERGVRSRVQRFYGLQTTIPDTVGYNEKNAMYALEDGGFRVRVMQRRVSASREQGVVVQQLPRGGQTRRVGWIVTIVVGR